MSYFGERRASVITTLPLHSESIGQILQRTMNQLTSLSRAAWYAGLWDAEWQWDVNESTSLTSLPEVGCHRVLKV